MAQVIVNATKNIDQETFAEVCAVFEHLVARIQNLEKKVKYLENHPSLV